MSDEMAWLIERADPNNPGCVLPDSFLGIQGSYDGVYGGGRFTWLPNASDAIRFARHKDAAMFVGAMALLQKDMILRDTIRGLRDGEPRAIVVEHRWCDSSLKSL